MCETNPLIKALPALKEIGFEPITTPLTVGKYDKRFEISLGQIQWDPKAEKWIAWGAPSAIAEAFRVIGEANALYRGPAAVPSKGVQLIAAERERQVKVEGWTPAWDTQHVHGEMAAAAASYLTGDRAHWPAGYWDIEWYKPKDQLSNLVRAGALIAAEIDRLLAGGLQGKGEPECVETK